MENWCSRACIVKLELHMDNQTVGHAGINGVRSTENIDASLKGKMRLEAKRLDTFTHVNWPSGTNLRSRDLARAGFYYMGTQDGVQCAFCGLEVSDWGQGEQPAQTHRRLNPSCPLVCGLEVGNVPQEVPSVAATPLGVSESQGQAAGGNMTWLENVAAGHTQDVPRHMEYFSVDDRTRSFVDTPTFRNLSPETLAKAGFFYTGTGNNVRCFHCGGGLGHLDPKQDPWVEHALNYPRCGFVRQCKGDTFIQGIKEQTSHNNPPPEAQAEAHSPQGAPGSYHLEAREIKAPLDTLTVQAVLGMGFSRHTVRRAIEQRLQNTGGYFTSAASLLDAVLNIEDEMNRQMAHRTDLKMAQGAAAMSASPHKESGYKPLKPTLSVAPSATRTEIESLREENKRLKEKHACKKCMQQDAVVLFLPCGHLAACVQCADGLENCIDCRETIEHKEKVKFK